MSEVTGQAAAKPPVETPTEPDSETAEFDAAFEEFANEEPADPSSTDGTPEPAAKPSEPADDAAAKPAEEPAKPADADADAGKPPADDKPDDIWAGASDAQRSAREADQKKLDALEHETRSNRQRMSHLTRRNAELEAGASISPTGSEAGGDEGGDEKTGEAGGFLETEEWKAMKTEYPEVAGPLEAMYKNQEATITDLRTKVAEVSEVQGENAANEEEAILATEHADWQTVADSNDFTAWLDGQPAYVQKEVLANAQNITDGRAAANILSQFKAQTTTPDPKPDPEPDPKPGDGSSTALADKRQRQLDASQAGESKGAGAGNSPRDDFDSAFEHYAAKHKA